MTEGPVPWEPTASLAARRLRAAVNREIRCFLEARGVLEVETPLLSRAANTDPCIESFVAEDAGGSWYLRTSPEFPMKRLLAADGHAIYELGRVFRQAESGRWHNPEFTMLEWYRPGFDGAALLAETIELVQAVARGHASFEPAYRTLTCDALLAATVGLEGCDEPTDHLLAALRDRAWYDGELARRDALDLLIACSVEVSAGAHDVVALTEFPVELAALARIDGARAQRFEIYVGGRELANGYDEVVDADELEQRFDAENERRRLANLTLMPRDERLLDAQRHGLPKCAGVALGVDRLLGWLGHAAGLADVINFPTDRA